MELFLGESRLRAAETSIPFDLSVKTKEEDNNYTTSYNTIDYAKIMFGDKMNQPHCRKLVEKLKKVIHL